IAIENYSRTSPSADPVEDAKKKNELDACLILLLKICLNLMHGVHDLQYTAYSNLFSSARNNNHSKDVNLSSTARPNRGPKLGTKRLGSVWKYTSVEQADPVKTPPPDDNQIENTEQSILDVLSSVHALSVLNILHNSITLYKRVIGSRQQCTPSNRWRHCSYHCLQILAARVLLFMVENSSVQDQLSQEPQLKILCAALDSTHDPQLLVLVLQIVATLSLSPHHHRNLVDHGLPDVLSQLLLPSDEWYYTNHSTKYAKYVKHHAARTLVYLGFQHRVNLKFSIYDILQEDAPPATPLMESAEDDYITQTSASPPLVVAPDSKNMLGVCIENAVVAVLKAIEVIYTDTDASTLRKRRKVNLTLDCSGWSSDPNTGAGDTLDLAQRHSFSRTFHRPSTSIHGRGDSISSASGLGLEPAMQAMQFAFSHILKPAQSRDSILSLLEEWLRISKIELNRNANVCRELRDFFNKITPCGAPYQQWCAELRQEFPVL
ncbi:uncharacterized protein LOC113472487, partial [Diaphorina citri]|uniref:Uncharacterized protein LOC113472487 n=1 Tax=Diaphorina citri TaxID=121845 RepID=A0A3Q0JI22_DIACI